MTTAKIWGGTPSASATRRARIPVARIGPAGRLPDIRPAAGHYLLAGIDIVLSGLSASPVPAHLSLADELRGALARTAACGDTCRVRQAADSVRLAAGLLRTGSAAEAELQLRGARAALVDRPRYPVVP